MYRMVNNGRVQDQRKYASTLNFQASWKTLAW